MKKSDNKQEYDLSILSLEELVESYKEIENFLSFLKEQHVEIEEGEK